MPSGDLVTLLGAPGNIQALLKHRADNAIFDIVGAGAPVSGTSGDGLNICGPGSTYFDKTNNLLYYNLGTAASPLWVDVTTQAEYAVRTRFTVAQINAGATLLPAIAGYKYQLLDASMIAVGGAVTATTTVDILATQAAGSVKLLAVAVAALTQSALVRAGAANATILADGASFAVNDVNTAVTVGKTGASAATATHVDVQARYLLVKA